MVSALVAEWHDVVLGKPGEPRLLAELGNSCTYKGGLISNPAVAPQGTDYHLLLSRASGEENSNGSVSGGQLWNIQYCIMLGLVNE